MTSSLSQPSTDLAVPKQCSLLNLIYPSATATSIDGPGSNQTLHSKTTYGSKLADVCLDCREGPASREGAANREVQPLQQVAEGDTRFRGDRPERGRGRSARGRGTRYGSSTHCLLLGYSEACLCTLA